MEEGTNNTRKTFLISNKILFSNYIKNLLKNEKIIIKIYSGFYSPKDRVLDKEIIQTFDFKI